MTMSDTKPDVPTFTPISEELVDKISGGDCTAQDWIDILGGLKDTYDSLVDFTSYVIERVVTSSTN
jgi:hypothetical protein